MPGVRRALVRVSFALLASACAASPYLAYRAAHPDWDGKFPDAGADLERTLAALAGPPARGYVATVQRVSVWKIAAPEWVAIDSAAVLRGSFHSSPDDRYAVTAVVECSADDGVHRFLRQQPSWYLLERDRLVAYDHYDFRAGCRVEDRFEPARGALVADEQALLARSSLCRPACATGALDAYEKGRAFARAGRLDEARAMLAIGDGSGSGEFAERARFADSRVGERADSESAAAQARAALVSELAAAGRPSR